MTEKKLPQGRLGRLVRIAAAGARSGAGLLLERDGTAAAQMAAEALSTLRGLAAKVGQMASYVDGMVPEGQQKAYEIAMTALRSAAARSSPAEVRALIEEELGAPLDRLYAVWTEEPIASASIGQVHRAVLHDGREVAVKVQHPGIAAAVESDLRNAGVVQGMVGAMGGKRFSPKEMYDVVCARFREELDFRLEARRMAEFSAIHAGDPHIRIPVVITERTSGAVLTMEFARGRSYEEACQAGDGERQAWARTLWRFVFKGNLVGGMFNADPHPGNYLFGEEGRITFLDFGCVQPIVPEQQRLARELHRAAMALDEAAFPVAGAAMVGARPGPLGTAAMHYLRRCFEPLFASPYHITRGYVASLVEEIMGMKKLVFKVNKDEFFSLPPDLLFMNRLQFGFYSVLARLDVTVDYAQVERGFWHLIGCGMHGA